MENAREIVRKLQEEFESGKIFRYLKPELLVSKNSKPSSSWSLCNRLIMLINGTDDARGFHQWNQVGRHVKKGAKAFGILAPRLIKKVDEKTQEEKKVLAGFLGVPVFRLEDTEGQPLPIEDLKPQVLPPLSEVAETWNIKINWEGVSNPNQSLCAFYQSNKNRIILHTHDDYTFLHELSHAAHDRVKKGLKNGQDPEQEFVAEFSAACLAEIFNLSDPVKKDSSMAYCQNYLRNAKNPTAVLLSGLSDVEKVLNLIISTEESHAKIAA